MHNPGNLYLIFKEPVKAEPSKVEEKVQAEPTKVQDEPKVQDESKEPVKVEAAQVKHARWGDEIEALKVFHFILLFFFWLLFSLIGNGI